ncbi:hypothetical protein BJ165DRAFT_1535057 [Panaeolus papilionaceus]|nr:hypothetical protein BJ165DRAFT_1535057 [Panaeolus papilionaceus]
MSRGHMQAPDDSELRLRLMTWLSLYDLLPQSLSCPQYGGSPAALDDAISPEVVRRCLDAIATQRPEFLATMPQSQLRDFLYSTLNSHSSSGSRARR